MSISSLLICVCLAQAVLDRTVTLTGGRPQRVEVVVPAGMALTGALQQGETDLALTLFEGSAPVAAFDTRERGIDPFAYIPAPGRYELEIRPVSATASGSFHLALSLAPATAATSTRARAVHQHTTAKALFAKGDRGSLRQTVELLEEARSLWQSLGDSEMELAALSGTGDAHYTMSAFAPAKATYEEALALSRARADVRSEAEILNNLAMVSWPLGDVQKALESLDAAEDRWRRLQFRYGEAIAVNNRGILLWESGEYGEARRTYQHALDMFDGLGDSRGTAYALNNMGVLLEALGEEPEALASLGRAVRLFRKTGDRVAEGRAEVRRARIRLATGDRAGAWSSVTRAVEALSATADRLAQADAYAQRARSFEADGRSARARFELRIALDRYRELDSRRGASDVLHDLGRSHLEDGDADNAAAYFVEALEIRRALDLKALEAETLYQLGVTERARGNAMAARRYLEDAIALVDTLRSGVLEKQLRASYGDSKRQYYAQYVAALLDLHETRPDAGFDRLAFEASERAKSRGLAELLRESWNRVSSSVPDELRAREESLRKQINYWSWQLWQRSAQAGTEAPRQEIQARLRDLIAAHDMAIADVRRADPRFASLLAPENVSAETIQHALASSGSTLVAYHLLEDATAVWIVTGDTLHVRRLRAASTIERTARVFVSQVSDNGMRSAGGLPSARALSRILLAPIEPLLHTQRLLFSPDGVLHFVPWSALSDRAGAPLVLSRDISVTHSATVLTLVNRAREDQGRPNGLIAAIGDPVFDRGDPRIGGTAPVAKRGRRSSFARLPHSRDEIEYILALAPPARRLRAVGFEASRALVLSDTLRDYRIVHLATHAVQDLSRPSLSGIVLSMIDRQGRDQDGFVRLHDIYNLRLRAELVVLSACETGTGREWAGEDVASLARGLFHAGAARVVSTLWKVDDEATSALMQAFYKALLGIGSRGPAAALRQAQEEIRQQPRWHHPYYWAGFTVQGAW